MASTSTSTSTPPPDDSFPWTSPDDLLSDSAASTWDTPLSAMADTFPTSDDSSPTEFAFGLPAMPDQSKSFLPPTISPTASMNGSFSGSFMPSNYPNAYNYSSASSFSSTGSATGSSFSSADALPAISREFARPSAVETRRPATAGGALQGGMRFQRIEKDADDVEAIEEENVFIDPFSPVGKENGKVPMAQETIDPKYHASRRESESLGNTPQWQMGDVSNSNILHQMQPLQSMPRSTASRPQTSDGLPTYTGLQQQSNIALPSARTIVGSLDHMAQPVFYNQASQNTGYAPYRDARASMPETLPTSQFSADRGYAVRPSYASQPKPSANSSGNEITFVPLGGPAPKKRPRRRYDEIERLYGCGWNGCEKSYGTLNHLNAHVAMQKHGEKRLPSEFKEMRKSWRKKKREAAANAANSQYPTNPTNWNRGSMSSSSGSEFDRRESTASVMTDYSHRPSIYSGYHDSSRPTTSSSGASSAADARPMTNGSYAQMPFMPPGQTPYTHGIQPMTDSRRSSAPFHIPIPQQQVSGFRQAEGDHPTPTPGNPFPTSGQARYAMPFQQQQHHQMHQHQHQQYPAQVQAQQHGFFQTLTAPMAMQGSGQDSGNSYQQFAFQR